MQDDGGQDIRHVLPTILAEIRPGDHYIMSDKDAPANPTSIRIPAPDAPAAVKLTFLREVAEQVAAYVRAKTGIVVNVAISVHKHYNELPAMQGLYDAAPAVGLERGEWTGSDKGGSYSHHDHDRHWDVTVYDNDMPHVLTPELEAALLEDATNGRR